MTVRGSFPSGPLRPPRALHFGRSVTRLFRNFTRLRFNFLPAPPPGIAWQTRDLIAICNLQARRSGRRTRRAVCERCARIHLKMAFENSRLGHQFRGFCGVRAYLLPVRTTRGPIGLCALRADGNGGVIIHGPTPPHARPQASDLQFRRAVLLLRTMARNLELRGESERQAMDLARMTRLLAARDREEKRLRRVLQRAVPALGGASAGPSPGARARQVIVAALDRIHHEYSRPLTLSEIALEFRMNASYLSSVFAREVGMPFKSYLTTLRLQRAEELLSDPLRRISEIASEVGYATTDRFRVAFRRWTGLPPSRWRDLLRADPGVTTPQRS